MRLLPTLAALLGTLLVACSSSSGTPHSSSPSSGSQRSGSASSVAESGSLCGFRDSPPATYQHVILFIPENKSAKQILGSKDNPSMNQTLIQHCGRTRNYH